MTVFKNLRNFQAWLDETLSPLYSGYILDSILSELVEKHGTNGSNYYELASWETKSKNPECYHYEVKIEYDSDEDVYRETYVF